MERVSVLVAACVLASCGGGDANCDANKFQGTYQVHYEQVSGNCGAVPDENILVDPNGNPQPDASCVINDEQSDPAACTADVDISCVDTQDDLKAHEVIHLDTKADGSGATGSIGISIVVASTGAAACNSIYDVTYKKL